MTTLTKTWQQYRATEHTAEIVLALSRLRLASRIREPIVGIQYVIAEVFENRAVKLFGPRASHDGYLGARCAPELRGIGRRQYLEFLQRIDGDQVIGTPRST